MKTSKIGSYILLFFVFFTVTSCFEIVEEVEMNSDGTGKLMFTLNMSQSKNKLASIMLLDSINGYKVPSKKDIQSGINDIISELKRAEGVRNIQKKEDYENFIFSVSCDFKKIENINNLTDEITRKQKNTASSTYLFNTSKSNFTRKYTYSNEIKKQYNKLHSENKKVFNDATYTIIYRFDKTIVTQKNPTAKISKSKKSSMQRINAMDFINGSSDISNSIQLQK
ncbi:MAG: hypothetical protein ACSHXF_03240 [Aquaticitalea sp.]